VRRTVKQSFVAALAALTATAGVLALPGSPASAASPPAVGTLGQRAGTAGCLQGGGVPAETCATAQALDGAGPVVVSPDGHNVYVGGSFDGGSVAVFARDAAGNVTQLAGADGCVSQAGNKGACGTASNLSHITDMALVGDNLYVANSDTKRVAILARDTATGALSENGCLQDGSLPASVTPGSCTPVKGLPAPSGLAGSPDGSTLFVTSYSGGGATGSLAVVSLDGGPVPPAPSGAGCYQSGFTAATPPAQDTCTLATGLVNPAGIVASPDGSNLYVASIGSASGEGAAVIFNVAGKTLTQPAGSEACIGSLAVCKPGRALVGATDLDISPDGKSVYVAARSPGGRGAAFTGGGLARLDRVGGALSQPAGASGCIVEPAVAGCATGRGLIGSGSVVVASDGKSVYSAAVALNKDATAGGQGAGSNAIGVFDRDEGGTLTQDDADRGCVSSAGASKCAVVRAVNSPGSSVNALAMAPFGGQLLASGDASKSLAILDRHQVDLSISTSAPGQPYIVGRTYTLTLTVQNAGPTDASHVAVTDVLSGRGGLIDATPSQGSCSAPPITCSLGTVKPFSATANPTGAVTILVRFTLNAAGTSTSTARVYADQGDVASSDNTSVTPLLAAGPGLTVVSGNGQTAGLGQPFAAPLKVALRNNAGQPISGAQVTFKSPASSPSAFFAASHTETVVTDSDGIATSTIPRADNQPGSYNVSASAANVSSVNFALANSTASPSPGSTPTATPTATISPTPGGRTHMLLQLTSSDTITPGTPSTMTAFGTANQNVTLRCYSRTPQNSQPGSAQPPYFDARKGVTSSGGDASFKLSPGTNTRCFVRYSDVADSDNTASNTIVQKVASALSLSAYRDGVRKYHFQGTILPHRSGQLITLYRLDGTGREIRTATTVTDASGIWRINRTFSGSGQFTFRARTGQTLTNVAGVSNSRLTIIH
jgi:uncharacterized repeat protein (TIGR01451 family)